MTILNYLLVCIDGMDSEGGAVSAYQIASARLNAKEWPLYRGTGYGKKIAADDSCVFYVGGQRNHSQSFIGFGVVESVEPAPRTWTEGDGSLITEPAERLIKFARVKVWQRPVGIRDHLDELGFITNRPRWGLHLMGGVKHLSADDFELICNAS